MKTLGELGERFILHNIVPEYCLSRGDDCVAIPVSSGDIVVTTDPVPSPAAEAIGGDRDPFWMGWLLVIINSSDLAAAGARPVAFLSALELPTTWTEHELRRLLQGTKHACEAEGLAYVGGNLKEGRHPVAVGTAVGHSSSGQSLTRRAAKLNDVLVSIGSGGLFWRDALRVRKGERVDKFNSPLFAPRSQVRAMHHLADRGLVRASIDNSDGMLPSLLELARSSGVVITVDLGALQVEGTESMGVDPARLWLGWGDWNVFATIDPAKLDEARAVAEQHSSVVVRIGRISDGVPQLMLSRNGKLCKAPRLESERFAKDSWFAEGIEGYIERLMSVELPE